VIKIEESLSAGENLMVSLAELQLIASRNKPLPESLVFVTHLQGHWWVSPVIVQLLLWIRLYLAAKASQYSNPVAPSVTFDCTVWFY